MKQKPPLELLAIAFRDVGTADLPELLLRSRALCSALELCEADPALSVVTELASGLAEFATQQMERITEIMSEVVAVKDRLLARQPIADADAAELMRRMRHDDDEWHKISEGK